MLPAKKTMQRTCDNDINPKLTNERTHVKTLVKKLQGNNNFFFLFFFPPTCSPKEVPQLVAKLMFRDMAS